MKRVCLLVLLVALGGCQNSSNMSGGNAPNSTGPADASASTADSATNGDSAANKEGAADGVTPSGGTMLRIAVIPKGTSHEFWKSVHAGAEAAAQELGNVRIIWKGPLQENDTRGQIDVMRNMITQRVDAICLAPNHSESLVDAVKEANDQNIPVVVFDSGLGKGPEIVSYVATDNEKGGRLAGQRLAEVVGDKGEVILLRYRAGSESTEQREKGFLAEIAEHPAIKVISSDQYGETTAKSAMDKSLQLLQRHQDEVDGVFAVCEPNCNGMLEALEQSGLAGKVKFVAFDPSERLIKGLDSGKVHGIVLQDPVQMGYKSVQAAVAKLRGESVESRIPTGEYVATKENKATDPFQRLLHPKLFSE